MHGEKSRRPPLQNVPLFFCSTPPLENRVGHIIFRHNDPSKGPTLACGRVSCYLATSWPKNKKFSGVPKDHGLAYTRGDVLRKVYEDEYKNLSWKNITDFTKFDIFANDVFVVGSRVIHQKGGVAIGGVSILPMCLRLLYGT